TLDAGRFRLPLVSAVRRLALEIPAGMLLLDGPGVVRGVAGAELLQGLVEAGGMDAVLALSGAGWAPPLLAELHALAVEVFVVQAAAEAVRPGRRLRARRRTARWDAGLAGSSEQCIDLAAVHLVGTPPPQLESAWVGRQIALLYQGRTVAMGEVVGLTGSRLTVRLPAPLSVAADVLLVRDAVRGADGLLETAVPFAAERLAWLPPPDVALSPAESGGPRMVGRVGTVTVHLVNGVFGDPLLHLRLAHQRRSLLFDLGEGGRLPLRIAHQVTDVFISHAHLDHIGGFLWLLRSRIGEFPSCRLYGPPGLARHIEGFLQAILWDRVAQRGPVFEVSELHEERLRRFRLQAGKKGCHLLEESMVVGGVLLDEAEFRVRAVTLDHHTPVLAFAFEPARQINIRKERLRARGLAPGPWLGELKRRLLTDDGRALIRLPDGNAAPAAELGAELTLVVPGKRLVYATDFADIPQNRQRLEDLARHAHTLFCEASFMEADAPLAARSGHLTTRACGEIATAAAVARLIPFHFSRRYGEDARQIYEEVRAACSRAVVPL
ncbi:MAG: MBL fold metallo-hydrolase, partial [Gammaproteobacteria bacterium]